MNRKLFYSCALSILFLLHSHSFFAQKHSTHQFRGPDRSGIYSGTLSATSIAKPQLMWKAELETGFSEIVADGNILYTFIAEQTDSLKGKEQLAALDAQSGKVLWKQDIDSMFFNEFGHGARSTPVVTNDRIYCLSSYGKLTACQKADGKILWQVDFMKEFGSTLPRWAFSTSPVLADGTLIAEVGGTNNRAFAGFDTQTGKVLWQKGQGPAAYSSPLVAKLHGKTQVIFSSAGMLYSFLPNGDSLWAIKCSMNGPMAMPVLMENNQVFVSTVRSRGYCIVEVNDAGAKEIFVGKTMKNDYSSSIYHKGYIYGFNVAALSCIDPQNGEVKWVKRGLGKGSLINVGDILFVLSDKGKLVQVKATPDAYTELGNYQGLKGKSWTAPTFADGKLYLRNLSEIACYDYSSK